MFQEEPILIVTEDGSHSLHLPIMNENYHSSHGAISESKLIFIEYGLMEIAKTCSDIHILEVGLGTGLNAALSLATAQKYHLNIHYTGIEAFPLKKEIYSKLNYTNICEDIDTCSFQKIHLSEWNIETTISPYFKLLKIEADASMLTLIPNQYNLVFFDAFAPQFQPVLWSDKVFCEVFNAMRQDAILTTYCCKGDVKRSLKNAGFTIEKLQGPKGKREVLRAKKQ